MLKGVTRIDGRVELELRELLIEAFRAAVDAADPGRVLAGRLPEAPAGRLVVVGAGKAAARMAAAVERHYPDSVRLEGLVICPHGSEHELGRGRIEVAYGSHPVPDAQGVEATERLLELVNGCGREDLVLVLLSGGGSALLCAPYGLELSDKARLTDGLLRSGADINEMNVVRKHLSRVKGGRLAQAAAPAPLLALVLSDVVGDDLSTIASGPTVPDPSSYADALEILDRYGIDAPAAREVLRQGTKGGRVETPAGEAQLEHARTLLVGSNQGSLEAAAAVLAGAGFAAHVLSNSVTGEAREVARVHGAVVRQILDHHQPFSAPCALLSGGETTVTVKGGGRGGRNGEFGLALALELPEDAPVWALAADTDGMDGNSGSAGVIIAPSLLAALDRRWAGERLAESDSRSVFAAHDGLLLTGPTGTNVNDLRIILIGDPRYGSSSYTPRQGGKS